MGSLLKCFCNANDFLRPRADAKVIGQINPPNHSGRIQEKLCRSSYVMSSHPCPVMEEIVTANDRAVFIGKEGKCISMPFA
jgi:hypothetical protein